MFFFFFFSYKRKAWDSAPCTLANQQAGTNAKVLSLIDIAIAPTGISTIVLAPYSPDIRFVLIRPKGPTVLDSFALNHIHHLRHALLRSNDTVNLPAHVDIRHVPVTVSELISPPPLPARLLSSE
jgi:hypothetical protein